MIVIDGMWQTFAAAVIPADAGPVQRDDMRMAFYAGATAIFAKLVQIGGLPEEEADAAMQMIQAEIDAFAVLMEAKANEGKPKH